MTFFHILEFPTDWKSPNDRSHIFSSSVGNFSDPIKDSEQVFGTVKDTTKMPLWQIDLFDLVQPTCSCQCHISMFYFILYENNKGNQWCYSVVIISVLNILRNQNYAKKY